MSEPIHIIIRPYDPKTDEAFVYATWTQNTFYSRKELISVQKKQWFGEKSKSIGEILKSAQVFIACHKNDPYTIAGYSVVDHGKTIWSYIKKDYRNDGVETLLTKQNEAKAA
jgi:hypothetical protein